MMSSEFEDPDLFEDIELPFDEGDGEYQSSDAVYYDGYLGFVGLKGFHPCHQSDTTNLKKRKEMSFVE